LQYFLIWKKIDIAKKKLILDDKIMNTKIVLLFYNIFLIYWLRF
jgi:hypothetical protein